MSSSKIPIATVLNALFFLTLLSLSHRVLANDTSLENVCHETDQPEICIQCLRSAKGTDLGTKLGIVTALITCLEEHGNSLGAKLLSIASGTKDDIGKRLFKRCSDNYLESNDGLNSAVDLLKRHDYDEAERTVTRVFYRHELCVHDIGEYKKVKVTSNVVYEMNIYKDLCEIVDRIIERL